MKLNEMRIKMAGETFRVCGFAIVASADAIMIIVAFYK